MRCVKYRGFYIDHVIFNSKQDIDNHIKQECISKYIRLCKYFISNPSMELTNILMGLEDKLHNECGLSYSEIEEIEMLTYK